MREEKADNSGNPRMRGYLQERPVGARFAQVGGLGSRQYREDHVGSGDGNAPPGRKSGCVSTTSQDRSILVDLIRSPFMVDLPRRNRSDPSIRFAWTSAGAANYLPHPPKALGMVLDPSLLRDRNIVAQSLSAYWTSSTAGSCSADLLA